MMLIKRENISDSDSDSDYKDVYAPSYMYLSESEDSL